MQWANENGIASGYDGEFSPDENITREQMAVMLYNYAKYAGTISNAEGMSIREFTDYDSISSWALQPIQWAMNNSIISGNTDGRKCHTRTGCKDDRGVHAGDDQIIEHQNKLGLINFRRFYDKTTVTTK